jgi:hypothetical protein
VTLLDTRPPIWRRIQVKDRTLDKLHEHIQTAMGWTNSHLHDFKIRGQDYGDPLPAGKVAGPRTIPSGDRSVLSLVLLPSWLGRLSPAGDKPHGAAFLPARFFGSPFDKISYPCLSSAGPSLLEKCNSGKDEKGGGLSPSGAGGQQPAPAFPARISLKS